MCPRNSVTIWQCDIGAGQPSCERPVERSVSIFSVEDADGTFPLNVHTAMQTGGPTLTEHDMK
jgi:hypothetical protein